MDDVHSAIRTHRSVFQSLGATGVFLFGSRARGDHRDDSDIDLFIDYDRDKRVPGLFELIEIERRLAVMTGHSVSITTRNALHPLMRDAIERDAIRLL